MTNIILKNQEAKDFCKTTPNSIKIGLEINKVTKKIEPYYYVETTQEKYGQWLIWFENQPKNLNFFNNCFRKISKLFKN